MGRSSEYNADLLPSIECGKHTKSSLLTARYPIPNLPQCVFGLIFKKCGRDDSVPDKATETGSRHLICGAASPSPSYDDDDEVEFGDEEEFDDD